MPPGGGPPQDETHVVLAHVVIASSFDAPSVCAASHVVKQVSSVHACSQSMSAVQSASATQAFASAQQLELRHVVHVGSPPSKPQAPGVPGGPDVGADLPRADHALLLCLQRRALQYFLDNQTPGGLVLDRQRNHGPRQERGLCSTAATGMGFIALALAAGPPYRLLAPRAAALRVRAGLA